VCGTLCVMFEEKVQKKPVQFGRLLLGVTLGVLAVACCILLLNEVTGVAEQPEDMNGKVSVQVGEEEIVATVVDLSAVNPETQTMVFGNEAMLVVFSDDVHAPQLKLPEQPVTVAWLDTAFHVVLVQDNLTYEEGGDEVFERPEGAFCALIVRPIVLTAGTLEVGDVVMFDDPYNLLTY